MSKTKNTLWAEDGKWELYNSAGDLLGFGSFCPDSPCDCVGIVVDWGEGIAENELREVLGE